ncbi:GNAT family N-acetyltransferase [Aspergillus clavatus NRRL 1]|uniref:GNAT family acetyltransferase, putative n=1 Tax=Aspergillus clavatus (strain ATCC 1007 / CBS 513.65 / DSM 816 / NCTC 3887 / NRRL 1 / QM 1276 / 107) TaxID=344612 RepID=A1CCV4_ASPCL|nr:GNAT family acetyltransferase, putative [Aspergillus clavatus NRRL 1]EAW12361.1 GNAT family acetyltransferase, putative [Aspergillus clavatus NRRL 1]
MDLLPSQSVRVILADPLPVLKTPQLVLRPMVNSDVEDLFAIRSRPEIAAMNHPKTPHQSIQDTREWMASKIFTEGPEDILGGSFAYAIIERGCSGTASEASPSDGRVIGAVYLNELVPCPEIGYCIQPEYWGKGYATEALGKFLEAWWALPRREQQSSGNGEEVEKIFAICEKPNIGSVKVLKKCGFKVFREARYEQDELLLCGLEKPRV